MMSSIVNKLTRLAILTVAGFALLWTSGCAPSLPPKIDVPQSELQALLTDKPEQLRPLYEKVLVEGERNLVLNYLQIGVAAIELEEFGLAEQALDQALLRIEGVYAGDENAAKARSLWHEEGAKTFLGEPYERAMAFYYRGLLYMRIGDYENARACFKSGVIQDAFAEEEQYRADFALLYFMQGWTSQLLGDRSLAKEAYGEVKALRPDFEPPHADDNTLVLAETGFSPRKISDGRGHSELKYRRGKFFKECKVACRLDDGFLPVYPMEDIYRQASTRGGRAVDKILEGKAHFAKTGHDVGTTLTSIGTGAILVSAALDSSAGMNIGAGLSAVGGVVTLVAMNAKPHADTRYWNNLPDTVHILTTKTSDQNAISALSYYNKDDFEQTEVSKVQVAMQTGENLLVWGRSRSALIP